MFRDRETFKAYPDPEDLKGGDFLYLLDSDMADRDERLENFELEISGGRIVPTYTLIWLWRHNDIP